MIVRACIVLLSYGLLGPAEESNTIPRSQQAVPPVGLVPHSAPAVEVEVEVEQEETPKEPEVAVVYMPAKKKAIGVKSPSAPLSCEDEVACRRLLIAGGIMAALGSASLVTGAVLHTQPDRLIVDDPAYMRSTRGVGVILMTAGAAVGISSALLLIASLRGRKDRSRTRSGAAAWLRAGSVRF